jgi:hypothetical protein
MYRVSARPQCWHLNDGCSNSSRITVHLGVASVQLRVTQHPTSARALCVKLPVTYTRSTYEAYLASITGLPLLCNAVRTAPLWNVFIHIQL